MQIDIYDKMFLFEKDNWWFKGRREIFLSLLRNLIHKKPQSRILDVGCGTGLMLYYLKDIGKASGIDSSPEALRYCKLRGLKQVLQGKAEKLPFKTSSFDIVVAFDLLEHIKEDQTALAEFARVLKPNGYLLISVPSFPILWSSHDRVHQHFRRYTQTELLEKIVKSGLTTQRVSFINTILFLPTFIFRLSIGQLNRLGIYQGHTDLINLPFMINEVLSFLFSLEALLLRYINLPIGITLLVIAKKDKFQPKMHSQKHYYDLDKDHYLTKDYYDNLAQNKTNFISSYIHRKRYQLTSQMVNRYYSPGKIIVDLACGNCTWNSQKLPVMGLDYSSRMLRYSLESGRINKGIKADITKKTNLKNDSADITVLTETLEHFEEPWKIVKEAYRILKPGGKIIVSVPYDTVFSLWRPLFAVLCFFQGNLLGKELYKYKCGHIQSFGPRDIKNLLENHNFRVIRQEHIFRFIQYTVAEK